MRPVYKRLAVAVFSFMVLLGIELFVYYSELAHFPRVEPKPVGNKSNFGFFLTVNIFDWGFGSYPSILTILFYCACLKERPRAYLHVCLYCSILFMCSVMQAGFSQPLYYNMYPQVYEDSEQFSCMRRFALPSLHAF